MAIPYLIQHCLWVKTRSTLQSQKWQQIGMS